MAKPKNGSINLPVPARTTGVIWRPTGASTAEAVVEIVRVVVPLPVTEAGTKLQELPAGKPVHDAEEKVMVPL
jgi:hypothetical protein